MVIRQRKVLHIRSFTIKAAPGDKWAIIKSTFDNSSRAWIPIFPVFIDLRPQIESFIDMHNRGVTQ